MWDAIPEKVRESLVVVGALLICPAIGLCLALVMWAIRRIRDRLPERVRRAPLVCAVVSAKGRIAGAAWIVPVCLIWWYMMGGNPLHELALIRHSSTVAGFIPGWDVLDEQGNAVEWTYGSRYTYTLSDGRNLTSTIRDYRGLPQELPYLEGRPYPVEVEYLSDRPAISRIMGSGCQTVMEWLGRQVGVGVLFVLFAVPGIALLLNRTDYLTGGRT